MPANTLEGRLEAARRRGRGPTSAEAGDHVPLVDAATGGAYVPTTVLLGLQVAGRSPGLRYPPVG